MIGRRHEDIPRKSLTDAVSLPYGSRCVFAPCETRLIERVGVTGEEYAYFRRCVSCVSRSRSRMGGRPCDSLESKGIVSQREGAACRVTRHLPRSCRTPSSQVDVNVPSIARGCAVPRNVADAWQLRSGSQ